MMPRIFLVLCLAAVAGCDSGKESVTPSARQEDPVKMAAPSPSPAPMGRQDSEPPPRREDLFPRTQEFVVAPLEGEPLWPSPADEKEVARRGFVPFKGGYQYELVDDTGKATQAGVVVDGRILLDHGVIELLGCGEHGKEHESILRLEADVQGLDLALNLCGFKRGPIPGRLNDPDVMQGSRVLVFLQWENENKKTVTHRAEDCVVHIQRK